MSDHLNWRNLDDLRRDTMKLAPALRDVDAIVGVPRSGMLPATILACALHKPLGMADMEGVIRLNGNSQFDPFGKHGLRQVVAYVDDSVLTGTAMNRFAPQGTVDLRCCVYVEPGAEEHVDHFAVQLESPRVFEWNIWRADPLIRKSMLDIDGVLCPDPPMAEEARTEYEEYIATAPLLNKPLHPVAAICTNRIEPYRQTTERWLSTHGIEYERLFMAPFETPAARRRMSSPADLKSAWYADHAEKIGGVLIESHDWIAQPVALNVGRPVISLESRRCFQP